MVQAGSTIAFARRILAFALLAMTPGAASAQLLVNKSFSPANVAPSQQSTLTIQVINNTTNVATGVNVTDPLPATPAGMRIAVGGATSNTCGGTVSAPLNGTSVTLTGGTVAAAVGGVAGSCAISVQVSASPAASGSSTTYVNVIAPANVSSSIGSTSSSASATLSVAPTLSLTGSMSFSPSVLKGDGTASRLRITLNNPNGYAVTGTSFTNTFPSTLIKATNQNQTTTCANATLGTTALAVQMVNAVIPSGGSCVIEVDVVARTPTAAGNGSVTNTIAASNIATDQKATNASAISANVTVQTGAAISKSFASATISADQTTTATVTIANYRAVPIGPFSLTDNLPNGLVASAPGSTTCPGGTLSISATSVTVSGVTLGAAPASSSGSTSCTFTFTVSTSADGTYVNTIPAGTIGGSSHGSASATLTTTAVRGIKSFSPTSIPRTGSSVLTITLYNRSPTSAAITSFTDSLTTMGSGITVGTTGAATTTCGGTLTAAAGSTSITLAGGSIPAVSGTTEGRCTITVPIDADRVASSGTRRNTVPAGALQTDKGSNTVAFTANLAITSPITVSKAFSPSTVVTGGQSRATITLTRTGGAALMTDLAFSDPLPSGFVIAAVPNAVTTCAGASLTAVPGATSFSMTGGTTGSTVTSASSCTVSVNIKAPMTNGTFTNTIAAGGVTAATAKGAVTNISAGSATLTTITSVTLNTAFSPTTITPRGTSRLSVFIANPASVGALTGVSLTDNLPMGLVLRAVPNATLTSSSGSCTGTIGASPGSSAVTITGGSVSAGAMCELSFDVTTESIGTLTNTLSPGAFTSTEGFSNGNTSSATLVSSGTSDVSITKTNGVTEQVAGRTTVYTLVVTNNSSSLSVSGLPVKDPAPTGMTTQSWSCSATTGSICEVVSGTEDLDSMVDLAPNGKATFLVTMLLSPTFAGTSITNVATVVPAGAGVNDPDPSNDTAQDVDSVASSADVSVTKTSSSTSLRVGETVVFTIVASNAGPSASLETTVADALPSGYDFVSASAEDGSYASPTWTIGTLAPDDTSTLTIVARARSSGVRTNTAVASSRTTDPVPANNTASVTPNIVGLSMAKSVSTISDPLNGTLRPKAIPGAFMQYRVTVSNETDGVIDSDTIVVSDVLPPEVSAFVGADPVSVTQGTVSSGLTVGSSDVGWSIQPGGGAPFTYVPTPDATGCDPAVTGIRIQTRGSMAAGSSANPSSVTFSFRVRVR
jgi:uncharacterized repeat protein (TIGR01451 family)